MPLKQVYDDGLSAPTRQIGQALTDIAKTVRLALFPFQVLAAVQDRAERFFIKRAVSKGSQGTESNAGSTAAWTSP